MRNLAACLARTNDVLCTQNPMDLFVTVFYCMFDPATGVLRYANGGHNPPYVRRADGSSRPWAGRAAWCSARCRASSIRIIRCSCGRATGWCSTPTA